MSPSLLTADRFTALAAAHLTAHGHPAEVVGGLLLEVVVDPQRVAQVRLHTLWALACRTAERDPTEALARLLGTVRAQVRPARDAASVVPWLRTTAQLAPLLASDPRLPSVSFAAGLWITFMFDRADHFRQVRRLDADLLQLTDDALCARALANLGARAEPRLVGTGAVRRLVLDGELDAALLALAPVWPGVEEELGVGLRAVALSPAQLVVLGPGAGPEELAPALRALPPPGVQGFSPAVALVRVAGVWQGSDDLGLSSCFPRGPIG